MAITQSWFIVSRALFVVQRGGRGGVGTGWYSGEVVLQRRRWPAQKLRLPGDPAPNPHPLTASSAAASSSSSLSTTVARREGPLQGRTTGQLAASVCNSVGTSMLWSSTAVSLPASSSGRRSPVVTERQTMLDVVSPMPGGDRDHAPCSPQKCRCRPHSLADKTAVSSRIRWCNRDGFLASPQKELRSSFWTALPWTAQLHHREQMGRISSATRDAQRITRSTRSTHRTLDADSSSHGALAQSLTEQRELAELLLDVESSEPERDLAGEVIPRLFPSRIESRWNMEEGLSISTLALA